MHKWNDLSFTFNEAANSFDQGFFQVTEYWNLATGNIVEWRIEATDTMRQDFLVGIEHQAKSRCGDLIVLQDLRKAFQGNIGSNRAISLYRIPRHSNSDLF